jgi:hypothetical protein
LQPGPVAHLSHVTSRGDVNVVGGDFTQNQYGVSIPRIDLRVGMKAEPLRRLFYSSDAVDEWLEKRKTHLVKSLVPKEKTRPPLFDLTRMFLEASDFAGDRKEFDSRVRDHLEICRERLVDNVLARIYRSEENKVSFIVSNPTDETVEAAKMSARFNAGDTVVLASEPHAKAMPPSPTWPDHMDRFLRPYDLTAGFTAPPFHRVPIRIHREGGIVQIDYVLGDLGPYQGMATAPVAIIPTIVEPNELEIRLTGYAKNRRDVTTSSEVLAIEDLGWPLENVVDPRDL